MSPELKAFLDVLFAGPVAQIPDVFDPWNDVSDDEANPTLAVEARRRRLEQHLGLRRPRLVLIAEAPSHKGARISGLAMTSEFQLCGGVVPRTEQTQRLSRARTPLKESTATMVWGELYKHGLAHSTVLWNAFPWHPHKAGDPHTNRPLSVGERREGSRILKLLLPVYPGATVVAVGKKAAKSLLELDESLRDLNIRKHEVRHPSMRGGPEFRKGLEQVIKEIR